jgi:putative hydrolase of the HAD superfamily
VLALIGCPRAAARHGPDESSSGQPPIVESRLVIRAVLWDFGGVILSSPFEAFHHYEQQRGLPTGFLRSVNATDPDVNAWARLERAELDHDAFDVAFAAESAALGHEVPGADVLALLAGEVRGEMVTALDRVRAAGYRTACLTNNVVSRDDEAARPDDGRPDVVAVMAKFDVVVESSKVGIRKPEPAFYALACDALGVTPAECVFLDDLGINLKPAREMGMTTIKVGDPAEAITELAQVLGISLT